MKELEPSIQGKKNQKRAGSRNFSILDTGHNFTSEDDALEYLSKIYIDIYFDYIKEQSKYAK